jgi:hypothetical protein
VHVAETREQARAELVDRWDHDRAAAPQASRIILTHTNDEVQALNEQARERMRAAGALGDEVAIGTVCGERRFAPGDRVLFLRNERGLGVKNGSLGTVDSVGAARMAVLLNDGRSVAFDIKDYREIDHGYAATIHKAQGMTVDRVHVLATPGLDRHSAYVALSRHRDAVDLHYGRDDFADQGKLVRALSRERGKDMASDYIGPAGGKQIVAQPAPKRDPFADLNLSRTEATGPTRSPLDRAVERVARAVADIMRLQRQGFGELPHQRVALDAAARELEALRPEGRRDLNAVFHANPGLVGDAAKGRTAAAIRAMVLEGEMRTDRTARADRFVADWRSHAGRAASLDRAGEGGRADGHRRAMMAMAKGLERDPQLESLLRNRVKELGIQPTAGASLSHELQRELTLSRSRGIGL